MALRRVMAGATLVLWQLVIPGPCHIDPQGARWATLIQEAGSHISAAMAMRCSCCPDYVGR